MEHPAASTETEPHKVSIPNGIFHGETMFPEGVDCGESGFPFSSHFPPHTFAEVRPQNWTDLTTDFSEWCQNLEPGELVSTPSFTLYDAMSAIELMDPKMDIGLLLKNRIVRPICRFKLEDSCRARCSLESRTLFVQFLECFWPVKGRGAGGLYCIRHLLENRLPTLIPLFKFILCLTIPELKKP